MNLPWDPLLHKAQGRQIDWYTFRFLLTIPLCVKHKTVLKLTRLTEIELTIVTSDLQ